jgi:hypothetical protein
MMRRERGIFPVWFQDVRQKMVEALPLGQAADGRGAFATGDRLFETGMNESRRRKRRLLWTRQTIKMISTYSSAPVDISEGSQLVCGGKL